MILRIPILFTNKKAPPIGWLFYWQRMRDSNPRERSQSPVCYRYTNPLCLTRILLYAQAKKSQAFFYNSSLIFHPATVSLPRCSTVIHRSPTEMAFLPTLLHEDTEKSPLLPDPEALSKYILIPDLFEGASAHDPGWT